MLMEDKDDGVLMEEEDVGVLTVEEDNRVSTVDKDGNDDGGVDDDGQLMVDGDKRLMVDDKTLNQNNFKKQNLRVGDASRTLKLEVDKFFKDAITSGGSDL